MIRSPVQDLYLRPSQLCLIKQIGVVYVCARAHTSPMPLSLGCRDVPQHKVMRHPVFGVISSSLPPHTTMRIRMRMQSSPDRAFQGGPSCSLRPRRRETSADAPSDSQYFKDLRRGVLRAFWDLNAENGVFFRTEVFLDSIFSFSLDFLA